MNLKSLTRPSPGIFVTSFLPCLILLLLFWAVSLHNLTIVPRVYEDEPWQASTGWKIAQEGVFASDMFAGWAGMESRYYGYMPLHPLALAVVYRISGLGLFQTRFEPVAFGILTLSLTYSLARRVFHTPRIGWLAVLLLLSTRVSGVTVYQPAGILFLDLARIARYDMLVPVFGLASLHTYLLAQKQNRDRWYVLSGALAGMAGLAHLYGAFWLLVLLILVLIDDKLFATVRRRFLAAAYVLLGFAAACVPYLLYVLGGLEDWRGQTRLYADRFDLLNPTWYFENLLTEYHRYGPGLDWSGPGVFLRIGFWAALVVVPVVLTALIWRTVKGDSSARIIIVPTLLLSLLFALLLRSKVANYTLTIFPLVAVAAAWGIVTAWTRLRHSRQGQLLRVAIALLLLSLVVEGATRIAVLEAAASETTPYEQFINRLRRAVPLNSRVLGYHTYWLGFADTDYHTFLVPLMWMDSQNRPRPLSLAEGLSRLAPDVVLLDGRMSDYFRNGVSPEGGVSVGFYQWLAQQDARIIGHVDDPTYGVVEIYRVTP